MVTYEENRWLVGDNHLSDGDQGMQAVWDQIDSIFREANANNINTKVEDLATMLDILELFANMN